MTRFCTALELSSEKWRWSSAVIASARYLERRSETAPSSPNSSSSFSSTTSATFSVRSPIAALGVLGHLLHLAADEVHLRGGRFAVQDARADLEGVDHGLLGRLARVDPGLDELGELGVADDEAVDQDAVLGEDDGGRGESECLCGFHG